MAFFVKVNGKSVASLVLGLLSLGLLCFTGVPAIVLGVAALREINRSDGVQKGRKLAVAGIVLGGLGTTVLGCGILAMIYNGIRETSNRVTCENNLRQIGFALHFYVDRNGYFPTGTVANDKLPPEQRLSWCTAILVFLEQDRSKANLDPNRAWYRLSEEIDKHQGWQAPANQKVAATPIRGFICPSWTGTLQAGEPAPTTYVGVGGLGKDGPLLPVEDPRAGLFGYDHKTKLGDVTRGISNTAMVIETGKDVGPWAAGGPSTVRPVVPKQEPYLGASRPFGGLHPRIANVLFVDGSVRQLANTIKPQVLEELATIHEAQK
jgi:prepilin-type processing-associated H-X9-DG protein